LSCRAVVSEPVTTETRKAMNASTTTPPGGLKLSPRAERAHAIKNCVATFYAVAHLLEQDLTGKAHERIVRAQEAVRRMRALLEEDLAAASTLVEDERCLVEDLVRAAVRRVEDRAAAGRVKLVVRCGKGTIHGCPQDLIEALGNILLNAVEVTPAGSTVYVATHEARDGAQLWRVRDRGPGFSPDVLAGLGAHVATSKEGGWGIGLALTKRIVERHAGVLRVDSSSGSGTVMSIWLPLGGP
jgi:signal transduction histidine kinase